VKAFSKMLVVATVAITGTLMPAQLHTPQPGPVAVSIDTVTLTDVTPDDIRFDVQSHVTSTQSLKIKQVRFERMRLGHLPIYLGPLQQSLTLEKGNTLNLPPIPLTIYFRDLDSLEPLEGVVRNQEAVVEGSARVDLGLSLERILGGVAHVDVPLKVTTPVELPGGVFGQAAALATLGTAQIALELAGSPLNLLRQSQRSWEAELRTRYIPTLVVAESRYALRMPNNQRVDVAVRGLGFRVSPDRFVLTGEMVEPWKYDTDVAAALQSGEASLVEDSRDLLVWPSREVTDASSARSLSRGTIQLDHTLAKTESTRVVVGNRDVKLQISRRDSDANYAVLRFTRPEDRGPPVHSQPGQADQSQTWDRLTLFRVDDSGNLESVPTAAHRQDSRILLDDPVDDRAFGSLILSPQGAVGMVQDEKSGMALHRLVTRGL
jgi:hypothetical protein